MILLQQTPVNNEERGGKIKVLYEVTDPKKVPSFWNIELPLTLKKLCVSAQNVFLKTLYETVTIG